MNRFATAFIDALQHRAARGALGPSSMRGRGNSGVVDAGRAFLGNLDLRQFGTVDPKRFRSRLDDATLALQHSFPRSAQHWGLARKGINLFLRDCLYTTYLREVYLLNRSEPHFEVPLDSFTGVALYEEAHGALGRWSTIRGLSPTVSDAYQEVASRVAARRHIHRVHLDAFWWGARQPDAAQ